MDERTFFIVSGVVFSLIAVLHVARLVFGWEAVIGGLVIPQWASIAALFISAFFAYSSIRLLVKGSKLV